MDQAKAVNWRFSLGLPHGRQTKLHEPSLLPHLPQLPGSALSASYSQQPEPKSNPAPLMWDSGILDNSFMARLKAHLKTVIHWRALSNSLVDLTPAVSLILIIYIGVHSWKGYQLSELSVFLSHAKHWFSLEAQVQIQVLSPHQWARQTSTLFFVLWN